MMRRDTRMGGLLVAVFTMMMACGPPTPVRPRLFKSALLRQRLGKLASDLFADEMVEGR